MQLPSPIRIERLLVDRSTCASALEVLSIEERQRLNGFGDEDRRRSFAVGRLAARTLLAPLLDCKPTDVPIHVRDDGSVGIPGDVFHVSISHSGEHVMAAAAPHPIGVDLEVVRIRPVSLYRFILHPDELDLVDHLPGTDDERIAVLWAIKESVLKGRRTGLRHSPKSLRLDFSDGALSPRSRSTDVRVLAPDAEWTATALLEDDVALAVARPA